MEEIPDSEKESASQLGIPARFALAGASIFLAGLLAGYWAGDHFPAYGIDLPTRYGWEYTHSFVYETGDVGPVYFNGMFFWIVAGPFLAVGLALLATGFALYKPKPSQGHTSG
jgi:hypothetical protein